MHLDFPTRPSNAQLIDSSHAQHITQVASIILGSLW